jgi:hypothetical protein
MAGIISPATTPNLTWADREHGKKVEGAVERQEWPLPAPSTRTPAGSTIVPLLAALDLSGHAGHEID